jgi:hypothetical protein
MRIEVFGVLLAATMVVQDVQAQPVQIAGIGVSRCAEFNRQRADAPPIEDYYFVWAQAFMSGVLLRAEPERDQTVKLVSAQFDPDRQREFLRDYCTKNPLRYFFHAVAALYQRLGGTSLDHLL